MLTCLDKMYTQKYKKSHKSWAISFQNALFSNPMNIIKNNADGASEKGCRLVITGDIVENSVGLSKIFDIYINIFKCLSYYFKEEELKYYTEQTFEKIIQLNFVNYGEFINSPKDFISKYFKDNLLPKDIEVKETETSNTEYNGKEVPNNKVEIDIDKNKEDKTLNTSNNNKNEVFEKEEEIIKEQSSSVMTENPFEKLNENKNNFIDENSDFDDDFNDEDDEFDPDLI